MQIKEQDKLSKKIVLMKKMGLRTEAQLSPIYQVFVSFQILKIAQWNSLI